MDKRTQYTEIELETLRKKAKSRFRVAVALAGVFFMAMLLLLVVYFWYESQQTWYHPRYSLLHQMIIAVIFSASIAFLAAILFYVLIAERAGDRFVNAYKDSCVLDAVRALDLYEDVSYDRKAGYSFQEIYDAAIVDCGVKWLFRGKDRLTGSYRGSSFVFGNVHTRRLWKNGTTLMAETIFRGQIIRFDTQKIYGGYFQIFQKKFLSNMKGRVGKYKIMTEDISFDKEFEVYATDVNDAYHILTPRLMEKITAFSQMAGAQTAISLIGSAMYIAVNQKFSVFDPKMDIPVIQQRQKIRDEIKILESAGDILLCLTT